MRAYHIFPGKTSDALKRIQLTSNVLGLHDVQIRVRAVSLNYRDLMVAKGKYLVQSDQPVVPCSDGAGEVIAIGAQVTRFRVGDRVAASFFPGWIDGEPTAAKLAGALGAAADGMLAEEVMLREDALVAIPSHLSFAEASTLPCAGLTAWNSLFVAGDLRPGNTVLLLGTGGVSIWALQLAKAAGLRVIITSSSDRKLQRAQELGADEIINYRAVPDWHKEVLRLTDGIGVDLAIEVGGNQTLKHSIEATRMGGTVAVIGGVSGFKSELEIVPVLAGCKRLIGIFVGSRTMLEELSRFVSSQRIGPVIDRVFDFDEARAAYAHLEGGGHFGKVVIDVAP